MASVIDPLLSLAFALSSTKGAYALLLGSGVSRGAGVPTGWEIVLDLVRRMAQLQGATAGTQDPAGWWRDTHGSEPTYDELLAQFAPTPTERQQLLRSYFEPTIEERDRGLKLPTEAHRAIADLVVRGYVRVILTTNFDQLVELALRDVGVQPRVIRTPEDIRGTLPLTVDGVTVAKLHGDYVDTRLRNTPAELEDYPKLLNRFLDRVLDEFGLVVCGWSAEYDKALADAIRRCPSHRFTTFWTQREPLKLAAEDLVQQRRAQVIGIKDADQFFRSLGEKVVAIEELNRPHPLTAAVAVTTLKRYLDPPEQPIRIHDLVRDTVEAAYAVSTGQMPQPTASDFGEQLAFLLSYLEAASETLMALMAAGAYWGSEQVRHLWSDAIDRLAIEKPAAAPDALALAWRSLQRYPAQLAFYAAGLGVIADDALGNLGALMFGPRLRGTDGKKSLHPPDLLHHLELLDYELSRRLPGQARHRTPMSDRLHEVLRQPLRELIPDDGDYDEAFDRFEYLVALAHVGLRHKRDPEAHVWGPVGRFSWRDGSNGKYALSAEVERLASVPGGPLSWLNGSGLFGANWQTFLKLKAEMDKVAFQLGHR